MDLQTKSKIGKITTSDSSEKPSVFVINLLVMWKFQNLFPTGGTMFLPETVELEDEEADCVFVIQACSLQLANTRQGQLNNENAASAVH